jgi:hypothetical protein
MKPHRRKRKSFHPQSPPSIMIVEAAFAAYRLFSLKNPDE